MGWKPGEGSDASFHRKVRAAVSWRGDLGEDWRKVREDGNPGLSNPASAMPTSGPEEGGGRRVQAGGAQPRGGQAGDSEQWGPQRELKSRGSRTC